MKYKRDFYKEKKPEPGSGSRCIQTFSFYGKISVSMCFSLLKSNFKVIAEFDFRYNSNMINFGKAHKKDTKTTLIVAVAFSD